MKVIMNPDTELADAVLKAVRRNDGYCPCKLEKTPDTQCMCRQFIESTDLGPCGCGLYIKVEA